MDKVKSSVSIQLPHEYGYQCPPNRFDHMEKLVNVFWVLDSSHALQGRGLRSTCLPCWGVNVTVFISTGKYVIGVLTKYSFFFIEAVSPASPLRWEPHQWIIKHQQVKVECRAVVDGRFPTCLPLMVQRPSLIFKILLVLHNII